MAILFPGESFAPQKPDLESIESFDNSQIGGIEKFGSVTTDVVSISDVLALTGGTMTGPILFAASAVGTPNASVRFQAGASPSAPNEGATWNDSTQKSLISYVNGIKQSLSGCIFSQTADVTIASTTTETTIIGSGVGTVTLPANFFTIGKTIRIRALGFFSDTGTPNITINVKLGATTIITTAATALAGTISSNYWEIEAILTCRTTGASGTVIGQGKFKYDESTHAGTTLGMVDTSADSIDTTASLAVDVTQTWGSSSASNTFTCTNFIVEVLY